MSDTMKHTPEPWEVSLGVPDKCKDSGRYKIPVMHPINGGPVKRMVALVFGNTPDECIANAKIISNAIEFKNALKSICIDWDNEDAKLYSEPIDSRKIKYAKKLIKKATGAND